MVRRWNAMRILHDEVLWGRSGSWDGISDGRWVMRWGELVRSASMGRRGANEA